MSSAAVVIRALGVNVFARFKDNIIGEEMGFIVPTTHISHIEKGPWFKVSF